MPWVSRTPDWINSPWNAEYYPWLDVSYPWLVTNPQTDWTVRTAKTSSWTPRVEPWLNSPWNPEYYPFQATSYPWLLENADVDWTPRGEQPIWSPQIQVGDNRYLPWQVMNENER